MCIRNTNLVSYEVLKFFMILDAAKKEAKEELEVLDDNNGGSGMGTGSAITAIGAGVFIFFIAACCIAICCK